MPRREGAAGPTLVTDVYRACGPGRREGAASETALDRDKLSRTIPRVVRAPFPRLRGSSPAEEQIEAHFAATIAGGHLASGARLPTIRAVAERCGIARTVVHAAYRRLQDRGLVEAVVGRGTVVADAAVAGAPTRDPVAPSARAALEACHRAGSAVSLPAGVELVADFAQFLPDSAGFAVDEFRASLQRVLGERGADLLGYGNPAGDDELRSRLVQRALPIDPTARPDELLITSGAQQGIDLVLRTFTSPGDAVIVPVPAYHHLFGLMACHGLEVLPVRWDDDGLDLDALGAALREPTARLLYLMPTFQNPTGRSLDARERRALMTLLGQTQIPVLEDDCASELRFTGEPQLSLRSLDRRGLTVSVRSFSKELFPGVRVGWVQAGASVLPAMAALKRYSDLETTPLLQAALVDFIDGGGLDRHLENLRSELRTRHAAAARALLASAPPRTTWTHPEGGFAVWLTAPAGLAADTIAQAAAARGVLVTPGGVFANDPQPCTSVRLSLSRANADQVAAGVAILSSVIAGERALRDPSSRQPLFL